MAHGGHGGGGGEQGPSLIPHTGPLTGVAGFTAGIAAIWMLVRYPTIGALAIIGGTVLASFVGDDGNILDHPFICLTAILFGFAIAGAHTKEK
jgi:hypothetical protein